MAVANALHLETGRRRGVPICFIFVARVKFEVAQPIRCRLRAFYCLYVTLRCDLELWPRDLDLWPLTLNISSRPASPRSNSVRNNLSEIEQLAAELLQFEYLNLWPWTCITCCAMLWDSLHEVWTQSSYLFMKSNDLSMLIRCDTLWPWPLTPWPWKFVVVPVSRV